MGFNVPDESEPVDGPARKVEHPMDLCRNCDSPRKVHLEYAGPAGPVSTQCKRFEPRASSKAVSELKPDIKVVADRVLRSHDSDDAVMLAGWVKQNLGRVFMVEPVPVKLSIALVEGSDRTHNKTYSVGLYVGDELMFCGNETSDARVAAKAADAYRMKLGLLFEYEATIQKMGDRDPCTIKLLAADTKDALAKLVDQLGDTALVNGVRIRKVE